MPTNPIDAAHGAAYALEGRVVTMDAQDRVLPHGRVYVAGGRVVAVIPTGAPPPAEHAGAPVIRTRGTIYPGLIELHNHLSYNALQLWAVPKRYTNRNQWSGIPVYRELVSGPMTVLGRTPGYVEAVVRYVEAKCLLGGVTTSQGIALFSNNGIARYYQGIVRNVEQTLEADLPEAVTHLADVEAVDAAAFFARLQRSTCMLLHLSEGTDAAAHAHFEALQLPDGTWALAPQLGGIHSVALTAPDFATMQAHGAAMVWSPLSNLLLYGQTADVRAAKQNGVRIGIGSDWSPSGSKNLLGELKVARLVSAALGGVFSDRELVAMATRDAAEILQWQQSLGSIEAGKRADLLVTADQRGDPYAALLEARETAIWLVVIDGVPRFGTQRLMAPFGPGTESLRVGHAQRVLNLAQATADPVVGALTLREARGRLRDGLQHLPELARALEAPRPLRVAVAEETRWFLRLDEGEPQGVALRPHLVEGPAGLEASRERAVVVAAQAPLSTIVHPLPLDPLTVEDDETFLERLAQERNLPDDVKQGLPGLFRG